ncbi:hypothetical protein [Mycolicibacterium tusciae]|uniref:hypothetical protein n=1 Tax=Mycolicibacterium tusciae TaxID=75922 RepID=UPI000488D90A|nr:hypothetical protein [Mycolicibacterium tusciae]
MTTSPPQFHSRARRPPAWQRWVLKAIYNFDRHMVDEWVTFMGDHLDRSGGATPKQTARYTVDLLHYVERLRLAAAILATQGNPAGRCQLADAALDLRSAFHGLYEARDQLLKAAGTERVTYD